MKNLKNWLNRNSFNFEVKEGFTGNELIFINIETLAADQVKRIKTYLKRYKFNFEYRCNYTFILAYKEENKNSSEVENVNKKELKPIFNADIEGHEEYQKEELKRYNSGALNFTHKRINNKMIEEYTKYFIYKDNTFMSVKPSEAGYTSGYYEHVRKYNYKVDHVNKIILFTDKEIEEVKPIKEEFYNNNEVEPVAEQTEKENNNYITLTKEQEKERIDLINLWSKKAPGDKEQGKERFLQLLFEYQEKKKTKEDFKKHINKLYAANKNIKAYYAGKKDFNNYLTDLLATEDILQKNDIIKNEFFTNAYNYIKNEVEEGKEMQPKEIKELEKKYNVDIKFREFRGKLMYSVFYSPLKNNVTGIFKDIKQLEKQCKSIIIDNRINLTNKINKLENEYLKNI